MQFKPANSRETLCYPKYCPESPIRLNQFRSTTSESIDPVLISRGAYTLSCSLDQKSGFYTPSNQGHQIAKANRACSFFLRGHCKKEDCEFAHDLSKVICRFWKTNSCIKGESCPFLHGYPVDAEMSDPLSSLPCTKTMDKRDKGSPPGFGHHLY
ncbi:CCR4-NOT transcription complex subunit 1 [Cichlidogyrus casuarinus]|uniref:CCR4-NOT transcription complex subunit 1 n=1 Tax=Cichlidogyrus casuarinus TaxID=1844966 RepID=A0ABD2PQ23_9PLAT